MVATDATVVAEDVEGEAEASEGEAGSGGEGEGSKRAAQYISFPKGAAIWAELEREAERAGKTPRVLVFEMLAGRYGVEVPVVAGRGGGGGARKKYASKEEAKAAQKVARDTKNAAIKAFLAQHAAEFDALMAQKARELAGAAA